MKQTAKRISIFAVKLFACAALCAAFSLVAFGQATVISEAEYKKATDQALEKASATYPRRETELKLSVTEVYGENIGNEPIETVLSEKIVKEFTTETRVRYEFNKVNTKGASVVKKLQIGAYCYEQQGKTWRRNETSCEQLEAYLSAAPATIEYSVADGTLDAKPVRIYRTVHTSRIIVAGEPPYIDEYRSYVDAAGRLLKREHLTGRGGEKTSLDNSKTYEYDLKIEPIRAPPTGKKTTRRK